MTHRTKTLLLVLLAALVFPGIVHAQRGGPPALRECGVHADLEIICGTLAPEDLEPAPDGRRILVSQYGRGANAGAAGIRLFDPEAKTFAPLTMGVEPRAGWGDAACTEPVANLGSHGFSLGRRPDGATALYVVNHAGRESIEMYEVRQTNQDPELIWRGCAIASRDYNDVAILPDGGFVGTFPTALQTGGNVFGGQTTGYVVRWSPAGETRLPGTDAAYPNGVVASADGRFAYIAVFSGRALHKYDLDRQTLVTTLALDFMPDNISWTPDGRLLAAGIKGASGNCPADSGAPCIQGFKIAEVDPESMQILHLFDSSPGPSAASGVSIALRFGAATYVGAFQGDRLIRIVWPSD